MKDFDLKKECKKENFDYSDFWKDEEDEDSKKILKDLSKGEPRKGIKGKYIKPKNHISKGQIKNSYKKYFSSF